MIAKPLLTIAALALALALSGPALSQGTPMRYVRLAELEIDPAQLEAFNAAIKEGIEAAVRLEPDVLALYAVAEKDQPNRIRVFELYTSEAAYQTHLATPHFQKFRTSTAEMVISRKLLDAIPVMLAAKPMQP